MEELKQEIEDLEEENRQLEETIRGLLDDFNNCKRYWLCTQ